MFAIYIHLIKRECAKDNRSGKLIVSSREKAACRCVTITLHNKYICN